MKTSGLHKETAPTMLHVGAALQDHQAGYIRRALRSLMPSITARDLGADRGKAAAPDDDALLGLRRGLRGSVLPSFGSGKSGGPAFVFFR